MTERLRLSQMENGYGAVRACVIVSLYAAATTHTFNSSGRVLNLTPQTTVSFILKLPVGLRYDGNDAVKPSNSQKKKGTRCTSADENSREADHQ